MSMLSDQAKQLRDTADRLDRIANVSTPWIHAKLVPMLREAADTIISLRDRLQDAELMRGTCKLVYGENDHGDDGWWCQSCGGWFAASFRHTGRDNIINPNYCQNCGWEVKR